jgi:sugar-specific transcriptional regulator TrmB
MPHRHSPGREDRDLLDGRAGDLYRELLGEGSLSSRDRRFTEPEDKEALATLVQLGLVVRESSRLIAVDPALIQSRVVGPIGQRAAELQAESAAWAATLSQLSQDYRRTTVARSPVDEIQGLANINRFLESVVGDARKEILTAQPAGARKAATLEAAVQRDLSALERGVTLRTLYQHSARRSVVTREHVDRVTAAGAKVRTLDEFFNRLIVVDRRLAIVPGAQGTTLAIAVHEPSLVAYLADIFERYWERATAFTDRERDTERAIADDVHNMTVRMLVEGHSDNASAKRMGVSTRTYAGYIAALKEEYGATTRFQLGHIMATQPERPSRAAEPSVEK